MSKKRGRPRKQITYQIETVNVDDADFLIDEETSCKICFAEFLDPEDLQLHINTVHETHYKERCMFCTLSLDCLGSLAIHIRDEHLTSLMLCSYCFRAFIDSNEFLLHKKLHVNNSKTEPYSCSNCKATFEYIKDVENHELKYHFDSESGVYLHKCLSILSASLNLNVVAFIQSLNTDTVYVCESCRYTNKSAQHYIGHLKDSKCRTYACDKCYNVYRKKQLLTQHVTTNEECMHLPSEKALKVKCSQCHNYFRKEIYAEHKIVCKVVACSVCHKKFDTMEEYAVHQSEEHVSSVEVVLCKYCQRQYVGDTVLQKHIIRAHKHELHLYKYSCAECSNIYKHPKLLFKHFNSRHPQLKPFTCKICDKSFKQRKKFSIHIKLEHNGVGKVQLGENSHIYFMEKTSDVDNTAHISENDVQSTADSNENQIENITETEAVTENTLDNNIEVEASSTETPSLDKENSLTNKTIKRMRKVRKRTSSDSSDDEPLTKKMKKVPRWNKRSKTLKPVQTRKEKKDFTCPHCKKYCYTFQNYKRHMSLHAKSVSLTCIKCHKRCESEEALNEHISKDHSNSKLIETLKSVLEKRSRNQETTTLKSELNTERFSRTIKKVNFVKSTESAVLHEVKTGLSKFIETFTPEVNKPPKKEIIISTNVSIKTVYDPPNRPPAIKMHKFVPPPIKNNNTKPFKLAMPTKCKFPSNANQPSAKITVVTSEHEYIPKFSLKINKMSQNSTEQQEVTKTESNPTDTEVVSEAVNEDHLYAHSEIQEYVYPEDPQTVIPEVAEEVMLAASEDAPKQKFTHKLILPNIPAAVAGIRIGHLLPEAPYYKIVHVKDLLDGEENTEKEKVKTEKANKEEEPVTLPSGTKLVSVNPLEHLLKDTSILQNEKPKKTKDYSSAVAKALLQLEQKTSERQVKSKINKQKPTERQKKLSKLAANLKILKEREASNANKKVNKKSKKATKKLLMDDETQVLIVEKQDSNQECDMDLMEEYLEDFTSDEEVTQTNVHDRDAMNNKTETFVDIKKESLSLPEL